LPKTLILNVYTAGVILSLEKREKIKIKQGKFRSPRGRGTKSLKVETRKPTPTKGGKKAKGRSLEDVNKQKCERRIKETSANSSRDALKEPRNKSKQQDPTRWEKGNLPKIVMDSSRLYHYQKEARRKDAGTALQNLGKRG